jgi:hypothetical protein
VDGTVTQRNALARSLDEIELPGAKGAQSDRSASARMRPSWTPETHLMLEGARRQLVLRLDAAPHNVI